MRKCIAIALSLMLIFTAVPALANMQSANEIAAEAAKALDKDQRVVNVFTWTYYIPDEVVEAFEDATGIRVNYTSFSSNEEMLGKMGYSRGLYDLMVISDYAVQALAEQELLTAVEPERLANYANINPAYMGQYFDPENLYSIPYTNTSPIIAYNPEKVALEITGYEDLWNEAFRGKLAVVDEMRTIIGMAARTLGYSYNETDPEHLKEIAEKLMALKENIAVFNSDTTHTALISGDAYAGVMYGSMVCAGREVMDIDVVFPTEGMGFGIDNYVIAADAPHLDATYIFLNYLLDGEVAAWAYDLIDYGGCNTAAREFMTEEYLADETVNIPAEHLAHAEMVQVLDEETQAIYSDMWVEFKK